jgi:predicted CopG family antitoxin
MRKQGLTDLSVIDFINKLYEQKRIDFQVWNKLFQAISENWNEETKFEVIKAIHEVLQKERKAS